jgi:hypothetical protein
MRTVRPFPSLTIEVPDDRREDDDLTSCYSCWMDGDSCLLQISSFVRESGDQVSAEDRLRARMQDGSGWSSFSLPAQPSGCEAAAAKTAGEDGTTWVHAYLVWPWIAIYITVSRQGDPQVCHWVWDAVASVRPVVM